MKEFNNSNPSFNQLKKMVKDLATIVVSQYTDKLKSENNTPQQDEKLIEIKQQEKEVSNVKWTETWGFWVNTGMLAFTAFLFWQTKIATRISDDNFKLAKKAFEDNIASSIKRDSLDSADRAFNRYYIDSSLKVSKNSADFQKESGIKQIRSYFALEGMRLEQWKLDSTIKVSIVMKNVGNTPAYKIQLKGLIILDANENNLKIQEVLEKKFEFGSDFAGAGQANKEYQVSSKVKLTQELANDYAAGKKSLYMLAIFYYNDAFNIKHRTRVFVRLDKNDKDFYLAGKYNDAY